MDGQWWVVLLHGVYAGNQQLLSIKTQHVTKYKLTYYGMSQQYIPLIINGLSDKRCEIHCTNIFISLVWFKRKKFWTFIAFTWQEMWHMSYYFGKVLILKLLPLFNKILIFCFNFLVRHPYLLHCNLLESVCKVNIRQWWKNQLHCPCNR